jgi:hypothetical protein
MRPSNPFDAQFRSECGAGDWIEAGEEIVMYDGVAYHNDPFCCPEVEEEDEDPWGL